VKNQINYRESKTKRICLPMENVAIIMCTYNGEKYIAEQIESIMNNTYKDFVLHICDDCSIDKTIAIAEKYREFYPSKIIIHENKENMKVVKNFLYWTKAIDAKYYMFCDQDDYWKPEKIKKSLDIIKNAELKAGNNMAIAAFSDAEIVDEKLDLLYPSFQKNERLNSEALSFEQILMENKLLGCSVIFNKSTKDYLKDYSSEIRMHDWWIGLIASAFGKVIYIDEPLLKYRQHGNNAVGSISLWKYVLQNVNNLDNQRQMLYAIFKQGSFFLNQYNDLLDKDRVEYLNIFSTIEEQSFFMRKYLFVKNKYRKTGLIKNIGMFLLV